MRSTLTPILYIALSCSIQALTVDSSDLAQVTAKLRSGNEIVRIVCFGDSVTGIYYHTGGRRAWPDMLGIALKEQYPKAKIEVYNAGISGNTTGAALERIDHDVIACKPHLVTVMFGLNDLVGGNRQAYRDNLKTIIRRCRESGAAVVLCTLNSVYPTRTFMASAPRPMPVVAEYSQIVRDVAQENSVPVADCFRAYEAIRSKSVTEWMLLMSEDIHPCMRGHKLFAETVAKAISGKPVSLADVPPLADMLHFTLARLKAGQPVSVIAMPPYDRIIRGVLLRLFPKAEINVTAWPVDGQSLAAMVKWSEGIRGQKPNLVVLAVPAGAETKDEESFIRDYQEIVSWSAAQDHAQWDLLPILPNVTGPVAPDELRRAELARRIIGGRDVEYVDRKSGDASPARQILLKRIRQWAIRHEPLAASDVTEMNLLGTQRSIAAFHGQARATT